MWIKKKKKKNVTETDFFWNFHTCHKNFGSHIVIPSDTFVWASELLTCISLTQLARLIWLGVLVAWQETSSRMCCTLTFSIQRSVIQILPTPTLIWVGLWQLYMKLQKLLQHHVIMFVTDLLEVNGCSRHTTKADEVNYCTNRYDPHLRLRFANNPGWD